MKTTKQEIHVFIGEKAVNGWLIAHPEAHVLHMSTAMAGNDSYTHLITILVEMPRDVKG